MGVYEVRLLQKIEPGPFRGTCFLDQIRGKSYWVEVGSDGRRLAFLEDPETEVHSLFPPEALQDANLGIIVTPVQEVVRHGLVHIVSTLLNQVPAEVTRTQRIPAKGPDYLLDRLTRFLQSKGYDPTSDTVAKYWSEGISTTKVLLRALQQQAAH